MDLISPEILQHIFSLTVRCIPTIPPSVWRSADEVPTLNPMPAILMDECITLSEEEELSRLNHPIMVYRYDLSVLMQVSRWWHSVCIGCPSLWTTIYVSRGSSNLVMWKWFERSKQLPLDIIFDFTTVGGMMTATSPFDDEEDHLPVAEIIPPAMVALQQHLHRCRSVSLTITSSSDVTYILHRLCSMDIYSSSMEQFRIVYLGSDHSNTTLSSILGGPVLSLRRLRLYRISPTILHSTTIENLTVLAIRSSFSISVEWDSLMSIFHASTRLEMLTLYEIVCLDVPAFTRGAGSLSSLTFLYLGRLDMDLAVSLLDAIDLTAIPELVLDFDGIASSVLCQRLCERIDGHVALLETVKKLSWSGLYAPDDVLCDVISRCQALEHLELRNAWYLFDMLERSTLDRFERFMGARADGTLDQFFLPLWCPRLTTLVTSGLKGLSLGSFAVARRVMGCRLQRIEMNVQDVKELELWIIKRIVTDVRLFHWP